MTYAEREAIMSKDIISTSEVAQLLGKSVSEASRVVAKIRALTRKQAHSAGTQEGRLQPKIIATL